MPEASVKLPFYILGDDRISNEYEIRDADHRILFSVDLSNSTFFSWETKELLAQVVRCLNANMKLDIEAMEKSGTGLIRADAKRWIE